MTASPRPLTIVITGSECTGKTTLAATVSERFGALRSLEFAREYVDLKQSPLDASDVEPIARGQLAGEKAADLEAAELGRTVVVRDTDLHSTVVYARHYYGRCPGWVVETARTRTGDLYLLLCPDVPWVADGLMRDRADEVARALIHGLFRDTLAEAGATVVEIRGAWPERQARAIAAVDMLIANASGGRPKAED
jgi:NadR type nicotinamide-nucleotide adenylyltransferase